MPTVRDESDPVTTEDDTPAPVATSRRSLFKVGAALAAATLVPARRASAQRIVRPRVGLPPKPTVPSAETNDLVLRLVNRITLGTTDEEVKRAKAMGYTKYLNYQLDHTRIDDSAVDAFVATNYGFLSQTGDQIYNVDAGALFGQLQQAAVYRAAYSKRQLYERMVEFWTDHFTIDINKVGYLKVLDDRDVIRKFALGKFRDLLWASAHSPAMLEYLDNTRSRGKTPNQNYARELMELHTLGVDGGYTQNDVNEVARVLTGWSIQGRGNFAFVPGLHDYTAKTFLGVNVPAAAASTGTAAVSEGELVLNTLLKHPNTAKFISTKMISWLLRYDPPDALVAKVADTYTKTDGDIKAMIRVILDPANLKAAPMKLKRPFHLVVSAVRATNAQARTTSTLVNTYLNQMGQVPFVWETPDGYPDDPGYWAGKILQRWNFAINLANIGPNTSGTGTQPAVYVDIAPIITTMEPTALVDAIGKAAFGSTMPAALETELTAYLSTGTLNTTRVREALGLALSSTSFQWY